MSPIGPCSLCGRRAASWSDGVCSPCAARHPLRRGPLPGDLAPEPDAPRHALLFVVGLVVGALVALALLVVALA